MQNNSCKISNRIKKKINIDIDDIDLGIDISYSIYSMKILIMEIISISSSFNIGISKIGYFMNYFWIDDLIEKIRFFQKFENIESLTEYHF